MGKIRLGLQGIAVKAAQAELRTERIAICEVEKVSETDIVAILKKYAELYGTVSIEVPRAL